MRRGEVIQGELFLIPPHPTPLHPKHITSCHRTSLAPTSPRPHTTPQQWCGVRWGGAECGGEVKFDHMRRCLMRAKRGGATSGNMCRHEAGLRCVVSRRCGVRRSEEMCGDARSSEEMRAPAWQVVLGAPIFFRTRSCGGRFLEPPSGLRPRFSDPPLRVPNGDGPQTCPKSGGLAQCCSMACPMLMCPVP